jgi:hypothetical protein
MFSMAKREPVLIDCKEIARVLGFKSVISASQLCRRGVFKTAQKFGNAWAADRVEVLLYQYYHGDDGRGRKAVGCKPSRAVVVPDPIPDPIPDPPQAAVKVEKKPVRKKTSDRALDPVSVPDPIPDTRPAAVKVEKKPARKKTKVVLS